ncbi:E3 ubiquitin-protein ligase RMA1H1-like [Papaver somniferum]|nr:E3 ubiquitin-protein ligase RMA1H1-like [Papaver somniferum]
MEQYFHEIMAQQADGNGIQPQKWKSVSAAAAAAAADAVTTTPLDNSVNACFDCNICLENAHEPVVTLCGHLYCWSCIYKWLHLQKATKEPENQPLCPVCKASVSLSSLVPLYGRGRGQRSSASEVEPDKKGPFPGLQIPCRPSACGAHALTAATPSRTIPRQLHQRNLIESQTRQQHQHRHDQPYFNQQPMFNLGGTTTMNAFNPVVEMFGDMVFARVFGNSETANMYGYQYPMSGSGSSRTSYSQAGNSSPRVRRQEMQAEKSLNRISIFLFCCFVLCLLLF